MERKREGLPEINRQDIKKMIIAAIALALLSYPVCTVGMHCTATDASCVYGRTSLWEGSPVIM